MKEARETRDVFREEREWLRQQLNSKNEFEETASARESTERLAQEETKRTKTQAGQGHHGWFVRIDWNNRGWYYRLPEILSAFFK